MIKKDKSISLKIVMIEEVLRNSERKVNNNYIKYELKIY